jgi:hypothetical protein
MAHLVESSKVEAALHLHAGWLSLLRAPLRIQPAQQRDRRHCARRKLRGLHLQAASGIARQVQQLQAARVQLNARVALLVQGK